MKQEIAGKTEHRSVKHFVAAGKALQSARFRFEQQQACLMRRGKAAAQKALDALPVSPELDLCVKIAWVKVPIPSKRGVIDLEVRLTRFTRTGVAYKSTEGPFPTSYWAGEVSAFTKRELERFGNFDVTISFGN